MTTIGPTPYSLQGLKPLTGLKPMKLSEEDAAKFQKQMRDIQTLAYTKPVGPTDSVHSQIKVNGKVVATVYNSGGAEMSNVAAARTKLTNDGEGPKLAAIRAAEIAAALGGDVIVTKTAQTQAEWKVRPPVKFEVDYKAMIADGILNPDGTWPDPSGTLRGVETANTLFQVKTLAEKNEAADTTAADMGALLDGLGESQDAKAKFLDFMSKTNEEKMRAMILAELGYTEEDLAGMDSDTRLKIEEEIKQRLETSVEKSLEEQGFDVTQLTQTELTNQLGTILAGSRKV